MHSSSLLMAIMAGGLAGALAQSTKTFNAPTVEEFAHINLLVSSPTNTSTVLGLLVRAPNHGGTYLRPATADTSDLRRIGNITGEIDGDILPIGAANELFPPGTNNTRSVSLSLTLDFRKFQAFVLTDDHPVLQQSIDGQYHGYHTPPEPRRRCPVRKTMRSSLLRV